MARKKTKIYENIISVEDLFTEKELRKGRYDSYVLVAFITFGFFVYLLFSMQYFAAVAMFIGSFVGWTIGAEDGYVRVRDRIELIRKSKGVVKGITFDNS